MRFSFVEFRLAVVSWLALIAVPFALAAGHPGWAIAMAMLGASGLVWNARSRSDRERKRQHLEEVRARRRASYARLSEETDDSPSAPSDRAAPPS